eukprot:NODE_22242_length_716_cov_3.760611.p4 GENE.NODE_22242_length_716_cov_3.760611~~NODE_22242_length_716_cov_3.760611.p4  ORF type:complete len:56 (+),score=7.33 NODE_22242_length_716_cov_3.760611:251-418(+)
MSSAPSSSGIRASTRTLLFDLLGRSVDEDEFSCVVFEHLRPARFDRSSTGWAKCT